MKSERGVTVISVTVYIITMLLAVTIIGILTGFFYKNIDVSSNADDINKQYTKFNAYFTEEVNIVGNTIVEMQVKDEGTENELAFIVFSSGNQYTFIKQNKGIYIGNTKIATNIEECKFKKQENNGKTTITVRITADNFDITTTYTLKK